LLTAQHPFGPKSLLKSLDFTDPWEGGGGGGTPHSPPI